MERWWNDTDRGEWSVGGTILTGGTDLPGDEPIPVPLCPPQISRALEWPGIEPRSPR